MWFLPDSRLPFHFHGSRSSVITSAAWPRQEVETKIQASVVCVLVRQTSSTRPNRRRSVRSSMQHGGSGYDILRLLKASKHVPAEEFCRILTPVQNAWARRPKEAASTLKSLGRQRFAVLAVRVLDCMQTLQIEADAVHHGITMSSCIQDQKWQMALWILGTMPARQVMPDMVCFNTAIDACKTGGQWLLALNLLNTMRSMTVFPDTISFNTAMSACAKEGLWQIVLNLLSDMPAERAVPNERTCNTAMSACRDGEQWQRALWLLGDMTRRKLRPDTISYNAAISACSDCGQWQLSLDLFGMMPKVKTKRDRITFTAAISACEKGDKWHLALSLLDGMREGAMMPDTICYSAAIGALQSGGHWQHALGLLGEMAELRVDRNEVTLGATIFACERQARWEEALAVLMWMEADNHVPSGIVVGSVLASMRESVEPDLARALLRVYRAKWEASCPGASSVEASQAQRATGITPPFKVLCQKPGLIVVSKPAGILTAHALDLLSAWTRTPLTGASRLDRLTSGILPAAVGGQATAAAQWLTAQYAGRLVSKRYVCLCHGIPTGGAEGEICSSLHTTATGPGLWRTEVSPKGKYARTRYRVVSTYCAPEHEPSMPYRSLRSLLLGQLETQQPSDTTLCEGSGGDQKPSALSLVWAWPLTGRTHQIRVHLASIGLPLVGENFYTRAAEHENMMEGTPVAPDHDWCPRLFLHCERVQLVGLDGESLAIEDELPPDLASVLASLRLLGEPNGS